MLETLKRVDVTNFHYKSIIYVHNSVVAEAISSGSNMVCELMMWFGKGLVEANICGQC